MPTLLVSVRFHEGRYHGAGAWPPAPARLFQALLAGAARGTTLPKDTEPALAWLERLDPPVIVAPSAHPGPDFKSYVPNNDFDATGGDPKKLEKARAPKQIRPYLFDPAEPLLYAWAFANEEDGIRHADTVCRMATDLYQLGRGIDLAWAVGEVISDTATLERRLATHCGVRWMPGFGSGGTTLLCPEPGSLAGLITRFAKKRQSFRSVGQGSNQLLFAQAPKPRFRTVAYDSPATHLLFDIRKGDAFAPQPAGRIVALVEALRDGAAKRLRTSGWREADVGREACLERVIIGRGATERDKARRIRITFLPSIGHDEADQAARRLLVTVPPDCPIRSDDVAWAFSGLALGHDPETGEVIRIVPAADRHMLTHYGLESSAAAEVWRSVTPVALPMAAIGRRAQGPQKASGGAGRSLDEATAQAAVRQALRHAGVLAPVSVIRVQREPFDRKGQRAEAFAAGTRFGGRRLRHVRITFARPVLGPLVIGDGRYLGLGLLAPVREPRGIFAFAITGGLADGAEPEGLARALRRAVMARVQQVLGDDTLPSFFTGHDAKGAPLREAAKTLHLACAFDPGGRRLLIVAPHILDRRQATTNERDSYIPTLRHALAGFSELRAGRAGHLALARILVEDDRDLLLRPSRQWTSATPYLATRHAKLGNAAKALEADLLEECQRRGLPRPAVTLATTFARPGKGLCGRVTLAFATAIHGPLLLGRNRHLGGGLFVSEG